MLGLKMHLALACLIVMDHCYQQAFSGCPMKSLMVFAGEQLQGSAGKHS